MKYILKGIRCKRSTTGPMNRDGTQIDLPQFFSWFVVEFSQTDLVWELRKHGCVFSVDFWWSSVKWTMFESCTNMAVAFQLICGQVQSNRPCLRVVKTWLWFFSWFVVKFSQMDCVWELRKHGCERVLLWPRLMCIRSVCYLTGHAFSALGW